jgi:non-ribosomal peptide synthetase component F
MDKHFHNKLMYLHHFFEQQVDARPDAPALISRSKTLTYREVEATANRIARLFEAKALRPAIWSACIFKGPSFPS